MPLRSKYFSIPLYCKCTKSEIEINSKCFSPSVFHQPLRTRGHLNIPGTGAINEPSVQLKSRWNEKCLFIPLRSKSQVILCTCLTIYGKFNKCIYTWVSQNQVFSCKTKWHVCLRKLVLTNSTNNIMTFTRQSAILSAQSQEDSVVS